MRLMEFAPAQSVEPAAVVEPVAVVESTAVVESAAVVESISYGPPQWAHRYAHQRIGLSPILCSNPMARMRSSG